MASEDARKLFVAGLPDSVTEEVLRDLFSESGAHITELTLPRDRMSGRPRGFAFVRLGTAEDAERARVALDGRIVDGRSISVRPFQAESPQRRDGGAPAPNGGGNERPPRREFGGASSTAPPDRTLYVGNLPYDTTPEEVESSLKGFGVEAVVRVHLPMDPEGRRRGFGFVTLGSADAAKSALDQLKVADLRGRRLIVNLAHPKGSSPPTSNGDANDHRAPRGFSVESPARFAAPPAFAAPRFGAPPPAFAAPPLPGAGKPVEGRRRKRFEGDGEGGRPAKGRREHEDRWRDDDDE